MGRRLQPTGLVNRTRYFLMHEQVGTLNIQEPIGWKNDDLEITRNKTYHGVKTTVTNDLKFTGDGKDFINSVRDSYGINADLRLIKDEKNPRTDEWTRVYSGLLDLSTWSQEDSKVSVKFNSSDLLKVIKNREGEEVEIDRDTTLDGNEITPLESKELLLKGRGIFLQSRLKTDKGTPAQEFSVDSDTGNWRSGFLGIPMAEVYTSDVNVQAILEGAFEEYSSQSLGTGIVEGMFYANNDKDKTFNLKIQVKFRVEITLLSDNYVDNPFLKLQITKYNNGENYDYASAEVLQTFTPINDKGVFEVDLTYENDSYELLAGESLALNMYWGAELGFAGLTNANFDIEVSDSTTQLDMLESSSFEQSKTKCYLPHEVCSRLIEIMTNRSDALYSEVLGRKDLGYQEEGEFSAVAIMNGFQIRQFPEDAINEDGDKLYKPPTMSYKDFIESFFTIGALGMGIENFGFQERVRIEPLTYFYQPIELIKLGQIKNGNFKYLQVSNVKRYEGEDYYASGVEIGYTKVKEYEEAFGLAEYNALNTYTTIINRLDKTFTKTSSFRADGYGIEFARRKPYNETSTEDTQYDTEIFMMDSVFNLSEVLEERLWNTVPDLEEAPTGVFDPDTAPNLRFTPFNMMLRHGWYLGAGLTKYPNDFVRYASSTLNSSLRTKFIGEPQYEENGKVQNNKLRRPRFVPEIIEFTFDTDFDTLQQVNGSTSINGVDIPNFYGLVSFKNEKGLIEYGFLLNLKPNSGKWKILKFNNL